MSTGTLEDKYKFLMIKLWAVFLYTDTVSALLSGLVQIVSILRFKSYFSLAFFSPQTLLDFSKNQHC